jgi:hypothetical protein
MGKVLVTAVPLAHVNTEGDTIMPSMPTHSSPRAVYERPQDVAMPENLRKWTTIIISSLTERDLEDPGERTARLNNLREFEEQLIQKEPSTDMIGLVAAELIKLDKGFTTQQSSNVFIRVANWNIGRALETLKRLTDNPEEGGNKEEFARVYQYLSDLREKLNEMKEDETATI